MESKATYVNAQLMKSAEMKTRMAESLTGVIVETAELIVASLAAEGKVLICGNGGSAADSQHIAAEFVGKYQIHRKGMPAIALTTDTSILTAVGNDYGYAQVFERQVEALGRKGDVLMGISTSGGSENVVLAMKKAQAMGLKIIGMTGGAEGAISAIADVTIRVPADMTARIQEGHIAAGHLICDLVEKHFFESNAAD